MSTTPAAAVDVACVLLFAVVGRTSHGESVAVIGVLHTAWPFLAGWAVGLLAARFWRDPIGGRTGVLVWLATVVGGVVLRLVSGSGAPWSFVVVAALVLGLLLLGWRGLYRLGSRSRAVRSPLS